MNRSQRRRAARISGRAAAPPAGAGDTTAALAAAAQLLQAGNSAAAAENLERILDGHPDLPEALHLLGIAGYRLGEKQAGMAHIARSLALAGDRAAFHDNYGQILQAEGRLDEAAARYRRTLELDPAYARAHGSLGEVLGALGRLDEAAASYRRALAAEPGNMAVRTGLGRVLKDLGELAAAIDCFRLVAAARSDAPAAHSNLGNALRTAGQLDEAAECYRRALALDPGFAEAHNNLGILHRARGEFEAAADCFQNAIRIKPRFAGAHSNLLFCMCHDSQVSAMDILAEARRWNQTHAVPLAGRIQAPVNDPDPERRLRVGYVSPDFRGHAVSYHLEPLLAHHDREAIEIFCYAEVRRPDAVTERYREHADRWHSTVGLSDGDVAALVRDDRIDVLVDLGGHAAGNRLLAFAERPAPVQVSHLLGYGQTTGMSAIDYVLADDVLAPRGSEELFSEEPWRLPGCYVSFRPNADWPAISALPARTRGYVTFASFVNPPRISPRAIDLWSRVLGAVPGARLLLKHHLLADRGVRERLRAGFAAHGVDGRVDFEGLERGWDAEMDVYGRVDIALDSSPLTGGTTTCIALWMGLPVVTLAGGGPHERRGGDYVGTVGLEDCVATDADDFARRAAALAGDIERLAGIRAGLRQRMGASPLLDHEGCARAVEEAYRGMWRIWCADRKQA